MAVYRRTDYRGEPAGDLRRLYHHPSGDAHRSSPLFQRLVVSHYVFEWSLGVVVSLYARSHTDVPRFSNYVIMPMAYLCNTFFSSDSIPHGLREVIRYLPLSQTSSMIRSIANEEPFSYTGIGILAVYLAVLTALAFCFLYKKKNL